MATKNSCFPRFLQNGRADIVSTSSQKEKQKVSGNADKKENTLDLLEQVVKSAGGYPEINEELHG